MPVKEWAEVYFGCCFYTEVNYRQVTVSTGAVLSNPLNLSSSIGGNRVSGFPLALQFRVYLVCLSSSLNLKLDMQDGPS